MRHEKCAIVRHEEGENCMIDMKKPERTVWRAINTLHLFPQVLWNCWVWHFAPQGAAGNLTSEGASLLDYKGCVPIARPHLEGVRGKESARREEVRKHYKEQL
jgi:hypothetical protein